jgi:hypothetical protein
MAQTLLYYLVWTIATRIEETTEEDRLERLLSKPE